MLQDQDAFSTLRSARPSKGRSTLLGQLLSHKTRSPKPAAVRLTAVFHNIDGGAKQDLGSEALGKEEVFTANRTCLRPVRLGGERRLIWRRGGGGEYKVGRNKLQEENFVPERRSSLNNDEFEAHANALEEIDSLELYVLKAHLLAEVALKGCLSRRLETTEDQLPQLNFDTLARLALLGLKPDVGPLLLQTRLLNKLRNEFAHRIEPTHYRATMRDFVLQGLAGSPWPKDEQMQLEAFRLELSMFLGYLQAFGGFIPVAEPRTMSQKLPRFSRGKGSSAQSGE